MQPLLNGSKACQSFIIPSTYAAKRHVATDQVTEKVRAQAEKEMKEYWTKNLSSTRPWSPHLSIYKANLCMNLSVLHRATGIVMSVVWVGAGIGALAFPGGLTSLVAMASNYSFGPAVIHSVKFLMAYPLIYHMLNGIRHLYWDNGKGLRIKEAYSSGYMVVVLSFLLSGAVALIKA